MISLEQAPKVLHLAYNDVNWVFDSTNKNNTNFKYIVDVYNEAGTTMLKRFLVPPRPVDKLGQINLSEFITDYLTYDLFNVAINQTSTAIKSQFPYLLKLGEAYSAVWEYDDYNYYADTVGNGLEGYIKLVSTTPHGYSVGNFIDVSQTDGGVLFPELEGLHKVLYIVNANEFVIDVQYYSLTNPGPTMGGTTTLKNNTISFFTNLLTTDVVCGVNGTMDRRGYINWDWADYSTHTLSTTNSLLSNLTDKYSMKRNVPLYVNFSYYNPVGSSLVTRVVYENDNGDIIRTLPISTSLSVTPRPWIRQTNVGTNTTNAVQVVSGTLPLIKPDTKYYTFYLSNDDGDQLTKLYRIDIDDSCEIENTHILYLDQLGSFLSQSFSLRKIEEKQIEQNSYNRTLDYNNLDSIFDGNIIYSGNITTRYTLNTNWMTEEQSNLFYILLSSPFKLMFLNGLYEPIKVLTMSDEVMSRRNNKLIRKTIQVELANKQKINI